jgi:hypothetical protein
MENQKGSAGFDELIDAALEDENEGDASETAGENNEDDSTSTDGEPGNEPEAEGNPEASKDEDEQFLEANAGKAIPYSAFQKKYQKWKKRHEEAVRQADEYRKKFESAGTRADSDPASLEKLKRYDSVFGNYVDASKRYPWLEGVLLELGQGKDPDWKVLNEALGKHLSASQPTTDPRLFKQIEELQAFKNKQENEAQVGSFQRQLDQEDLQIRKTYGEEVNDEFFELVNSIAAGQASMLPPNAPVTAYPNRVEIAKRVNALMKTRLEASLKKQIPVAQKRANVNLNNGRGPAGAEKQSIPVPGSQAFYEYIADDANLAHLTDEK